MPAVVQSNPRAEADAAANAAAKAANADAAARRRRKQGSSLLTAGSQGVIDSGASLLSSASATAGKSTLGS